MSSKKLFFSLENFFLWQASGQRQVHSGVSVLTAEPFWDTSIIYVATVCFVIYPVEFITSIFFVNFDFLFICCLHSVVLIFLQESLHFQKVLTATVREWFCMWIRQIESDTFSNISLWLLLRFERVMSCNIFIFSSFHFSFLCIAVLRSAIYSADTIIFL